MSSRNLSKNQCGRSGINEALDKKLFRGLVKFCQTVGHRQLLKHCVNSAREVLSFYGTLPITLYWLEINDTSRLVEMLCRTETYPTHHKNHLTWLFARMKSAEQKLRSKSESNLRDYSGVKFEGHPDFAVVEGSVTGRTTHTTSYVETVEERIRRLVTTNFYDPLRPFVCDNDEGTALSVAYGQLIVGLAKHCKEHKQFPVFANKPNIVRWRAYISDHNLLPTSMHPKFDSLIERWKLSKDLEKVVDDTTPETVREQDRVAISNMVVTHFTNPLVNQINGDDPKTFPGIIVDLGRILTAELIKAEPSYFVSPLVPWEDGNAREPNPKEFVSCCLHMLGSESEFAKQYKTHIAYSLCQRYEDSKVGNQVSATPPQEQETYRQLSATVSSTLAKHFLEPLIQLTGEGLREANTVRQVCAQLYTELMESTDQVVSEFVKDYTKTDKVVSPSNLIDYLQQRGVPKCYEHYQLSIVRQLAKRHDERQAIDNCPGKQKQPAATAKTSQFEPLDTAVSVILAECLLSQITPADPVTYAVVINGLGSALRNELASRSQHFRDEAMASFKVTNPDPADFLRYLTNKLGGKLNWEPNFGYNWAYVMSVTDTLFDRWRTSRQVSPKSDEVCATFSKLHSWLSKHLGQPLLSVCEDHHLNRAINWLANLLWDNGIQTFPEVDNNPGGILWLVESRVANRTIDLAKTSDLNNCFQYLRLLVGQWQKKQRELFYGATQKAESGSASQPVNLPSPRILENRLYPEAAKSYRHLTNWFVEHLQDPLTQFCFSDELPKLTEATYWARDTYWEVGLHVENLQVVTPPSKQAKDIYDTLKLRASEDNVLCTPHMLLLHRFIKMLEIAEKQEKWELTSQWVVKHFINPLRPFCANDEEKHRLDLSADFAIQCILSHNIDLGMKYPSRPIYIKTTLKLIESAVESLPKDKEDSNASSLVLFWELVSRYLKSQTSESAPASSNLSYHDLIENYLRQPLTKFVPKGKDKAFYCALVWAKETLTGSGINAASYRVRDVGGMLAALECAVAAVRSKFPTAKFALDNTHLEFLRQLYDSYRTFLANASSGTWIGDNPLEAKSGCDSPKTNLHVVPPSDDWVWPEHVKPGTWLFQQPTEDNKWFLSSVKPEYMQGSGYNDDDGGFWSYAGSETWSVMTFTPPPCDNWRDSLRQKPFPVVDQIASSETAMLQREVMRDFCLVEDQRLVDAAKLVAVDSERSPQTHDPNDIVAIIPETTKQAFAVWDSISSPKPTKHEVKASQFQKTITIGPDTKGVVVGIDPGNLAGDKSVWQLFEQVDGGKFYTLVRERSQIVLSYDNSNYWTSPKDKPSPPEPERFELFDTVDTCLTTWFRTPLHNLCEEAVEHRAVEVTANDFRDLVLMYPALFPRNRSDWLSLFTQGTPTHVWNTFNDTLGSKKFTLGIERNSATIVLGILNRIAADRRKNGQPELCPVPLFEGEPVSELKDQALDEDQRTIIEMHTENFMTQFFPVTGGCDTHFSAVTGGWDSDDMAKLRQQTKVLSMLLCRAGMQEACKLLSYGHLDTVLIRAKDYKLDSDTETLDFEFLGSMLNKLRAAGLHVPDATTPDAKV